MKKLVFVYLQIFIVVLPCYTQTIKSMSYALIVGVSEYNDPKIRSLNYAHSDAMAFAAFCRSSSGLNIPENQVILRVNKDATWVNIMDDMDWLKTTAKKNDQIYIYFAGHGDIESINLKEVYLLTQDSRHQNYMFRSIPLSTLDKLAKTLAIDTRAKIFIITDACHSGQLANPAFNNDNHLNAQLSRVRDKNEVRITSCKEFEESYEDIIWGNGRGAFSYFLTTGMAGEADGVIKGIKDNKISIAEINKYLSDNVPKNVQKVKSKRQNPIIKGLDETIINHYKPEALKELTSSLSTSQVNVPNTSGSRGIDAASDQDFTTFVKEIVFKKINDNKTDLKSLASRSSLQIKAELIKEMVIIKKTSKKRITDNVSYRMIAKALYENHQNFIDEYLTGDEQVLNEIKSSNLFDQYPHMLQIAIKLLPKDHYLVDVFEMQKEFLTGMGLRLKIQEGQNQTDLLETAIKHQEKALSIAPSAAFVHNELGILYKYKKDEKARYHFEKAIEISPEWKVPQTNLSQL